MKKILIFLIFIGLMINITLADTLVYEKPDIKIVVEGNTLKLDKEVPIIVNSRTLIPLRKLLVGLGVPDNTENIKWIGEERKVEVIYEGIKIELKIDNLEAYINGVKYNLDSAPIIYRDRTYLPARFVGEALGYNISWDQYTPAVLVTSNSNIEKITQILDKLNNIMSTVKSYEVFTKQDIKEMSNIEGSVNSLKYTISSLEKADLINKIIYTENTYKDEKETNINYFYYTPTTLYNCYKYVQDEVLHNTGWDIWDYSKEPVNIFDDKQKVGLLNIDKVLYGAFICKEYEDLYEISTVSNQIDVLKVLGDKDIYEKTLSYNSFDNLKFRLSIDKTTNLPVTLLVECDMKFNEGKISTNESIEYTTEFISYNENVDVALPKP